MTDKTSFQFKASDGRAWPLQERTCLTIGRASANDIIIKDSIVSKNHAFVIFQDDRCIVYDLGSANGTVINGRRLDRPQQLSTGETLEIGPMTFQVIPATTGARVQDADRTNSLYIGLGTLALLIFFLALATSGSNRGRTIGSQAVIAATQSTSEMILSETNLSPKNPATVNRFVTMDDDVRIQHPSGLVIDIPADGLYEDSAITIRRIANYVDDSLDPGKNFLDVYDIDLVSDEVFARPVTLTFPYDETRIPYGVPEANLYVAYNFSDEWIRIPSEVNTETNVVQVKTLHNGFWSVIFETRPNINAEINVFLMKYLNDLDIVERAESKEEAREEALIRKDEYQFAWAKCDVTAEEIRQDLNPFNLPRETTELLRLLGLASEIEDEDVYRHVKSHVSFHMIENMIRGLGGKAAVLEVGGGSAGVWLGKLSLATGVGLYIGPLIGDSINGAVCLWQWQHAYQRWREAEIVYEQLANPDRNNLMAEEVMLLENYMDMQMKLYAAYAPGTLIDWTLSAVEPVILLSTPVVTATTFLTPTPAPAVISTATVPPSMASSTASSEGDTCSWTGIIVGTWTADGGFIREFRSDNTTTTYNSGNALLDSGIWSCQPDDRLDISNTGSQPLNCALTVADPDKIVADCYGKTIQWTRKSTNGVAALEAGAADVCFWTTKIIGDWTSTGGSWDLQFSPDGTAYAFLPSIQDYTTWHCHPAQGMLTVAQYGTWMVAFESEDEMILSDSEHVFTWLRK